MLFFGKEQDNMKNYLTVLLVRLVLPAGLLLSIALRPFGISLIYLILFLIAPLTGVPDSLTFRGFRGRYLLLVFLISFLLLLSHAAWHSVLAAFPPYGSLLEEYPIIQAIGHNLGLVSWSGIDPLMAVHLLMPEIVMTIISLAVYMLVKMLLTGVTAPESKSSKHQQFPILTSAGKYLCLLLIMLSGVMRPSVTSGIYFLVFMGAATAWAVGQPLGKGFAVLGRCVMAVMAVHTAGLLVYQCTFLIEIYPPEKDMARYFGLTKLVILNQSEPSSFEYEVTDDHMWATLASPLVILFTYFVLAIETRELFKPKPKEKSTLTGLEAGKMSSSALVRAMSFHRGSKHLTKEKWMNATKKVRVAYSYINSKALRGNTSETAPLMRNVSPSKRWLNVRSFSHLHQDSTGSVIVPDAESVMSIEKPTLTDDIIAAVIDLFQVLVRSSYIATTITMMTWSIMFHSWLTFVLLMWANVVWLCQDQRSFMLKTSPVLVCYAMLLLLAQYIYGMNLYETELPSNFTDFNLHQIGLGRADGEPCIPLLIKSLFTCMFWVTLRQRVQEIRQRRRSAVITDMAAPLQLTVSTAASVIEAQREEEGHSRLLRAFGKGLRAACARYWIYVVVIMLFVIGVTGGRMTIFRIIYMFLFLSFILMFQISLYWWRRLMYLFWIILIGYSMLNLMLLYIYQFDNFSTIIETYLHINEKLQHSLGLEPYHPADLFVKLLTPTLFLIITIMQVHYFHKDFMALSDPKTRTNSVAREPGSGRPSQAGASTMNNDQVPPLPAEDGQPASLGDSPTEAEHSIEMSSLNSAARRKASRSYAPTDRRSQSTAFKTVMLKKILVLRQEAYQWMDKMFIFLNTHLVKIIFLALMLLCTMNVCAMHVPIMLIISPALLLNARMQRISVLIISTLISIYVMAKMVYQIDYILHSYFDVECTKIIDANRTEIIKMNNAEWFGFTKATSKRPITVIMKGYIALIAVFTFYSLVTYRQQSMREQGLLTKDREKVMFPNVTRKEADIDMKHFLKYLMNYGFYKFGVEITLICLIGVIGSRMDVYAVFYAGWLLVLVSIKRPLQARVWPTFTAWVTFLIPLQYMMSVGFLPQLCITYPWSGEARGGEELYNIKQVRTWLFLPYADDPPHAMKLIFDYFLLLFASRQVRVFKIEQTQGENYAGGSNSEDIGKDWETPTFVNPVPDFLGLVSSALDVLKRMVFLGMLWVTLAIMFMTGTNRVNLFSMGYLIGSFIFLWQGTDFYLRPKHVILQWWSWLVRYNVGVVVVKTLLQIPGCIFSDVMKQHACWLVQLLGIGCVDKFAGRNVAQFLKMRIDQELQNSVCSVPQEDIGLAWDGVCFAFLILQRRMFHSYYFYRVIDDSKATTVLASRGAELIEELRQKQMKVQEETEKKILEKIKVKMERIKANQKKVQGALSKEPRHHDEGSDTDLTTRRRVYTKRHQAIRSGDYYMFDEFDDVDIDSEESSSDEEGPTEMGFGKLLSTVFKTDLKRAVSLRRSSAPAVRTPQHLSFGSYPQSYPREKPRQSSRKRSETNESDVVLSEREPPKDGPLSELDDIDSESGQPTKLDKLRNLMETVSAFISSLFVSLTRFLMKFSRDYRYVSRSLSAEKNKLKEMEGFGIGLREGSQMIWEPLPGSLPKNRKLSDISVPEIRLIAPSMERGLDASPPSHRASPASQQVGQLAGRESSQDSYRRDDDDTSEHESAFSLQTISSKDVTTLEEHDDTEFKKGKSSFVFLLYALWYTVLAHTDIVCYMMVFINQIQSATILSIPLPLMVFLWGTLSIPRPTKTFWVTLIAYTEVIVLIKSMFQFEILPWNQKVIAANMPFTAPRIIGIERKVNYALYDLLLLLIIFLHRFMLKSLGLWKESTSDIELREDEEYPLSPEDTQQIIAGKFSEVGLKCVKLHDLTGPKSDEKKEDNVSTHEEEVADNNDDDDDDNEAGPSKPYDDHYNVHDDQEPIIAVTTTLDENASKHYPKVMLLSIKQYLGPVYVFFKSMLTPGARVTADVYAYMFLCDFLNFLVVIFGFAAFGTQQGDGGVQEYLEENKVPVPFLVMMILQFGLIIIDRALYLRKYMLGKILFQHALIVGVHVWMFFALPFITERTFNALLPPPLWYMIKCIYLLLSAYQIRCGYPRRIIGNFLCKSYNYVHMICFRGFMAVPFVFELRTLMDWIWTDTSMTLMDWLKMEDIFANVYLLKCSRYVEDAYPLPRGEKKSNMSKYMLGGAVLVFVIAIIWFPLVFFAFGNSVGKANPPTDVTVKIRIGPFLPIYQMSAQSHNIAVFTEQDYAQLSNLHPRDRTVQTFLSNYMHDDIAVITINPNSTMNWEISPPELQRLKQEAISNSTLQVKFKYVITHPSNAMQNPPVLDDSRISLIPAHIWKGGVMIPNPERETLLALLDGTAPPDTWLNVDALFPKFLKVFNKGSTKPVHQLMPAVRDGDTNTSLEYRNMQMRLERDNGSMYWRVRERCSQPIEPLISLPMNDCDLLIMYTFNDKLFPESLNIISGSGIIGLYSTFVFLASRVLRGFFSGIYTRIMFDDLPNVDRVLQLCLDIYLVREALELKLEEDLFAKLVFLYRSPETMIKWTRLKDDPGSIRALPPSR